MQKFLIVFATQIMIGFFRQLAQVVWNDFWLLVDEAVRDAEKQWRDRGKGLIKEDWVVEKAISFIEKKKKLNWIQRRSVERVLRYVIRKLIDQLNKENSKNWSLYVTSLKDYLAKLIPVIE